VPLALETQRRDAVVGCEADAEAVGVGVPEVEIAGVQPDRQREVGQVFRDRARFVTVSNCRLVKPSSHGASHIPLAATARHTAIAKPHFNVYFCFMFVSAGPASCPPAHAQAWHPSLRHIVFGTAPAAPKTIEGSVALYGAFVHHQIRAQCKMQALKGRDIPAQGNALGNEAKTDEP
jgi:hypothetical protein